MKKLFLIICLAIALSPLPLKAESLVKDSDVAVSIAPIHSLVVAIMDGVAEPSLIMQSQNSLHGVSLKPSERMKIHQAKLLFYIDDKFERFLTPVLKQSQHLRAEPLSASAGLILKPLGSPHTHTETHEEHAHHHDEEEEALIAKPLDYHLWLSPENTLLMVRHIAKILKETYPTFADKFEQNRLALENKIIAEASNWQAQLLSVKAKPFVVFHDAYAYLVDYFELNQVGVVNGSPEMPSSIKHLKALHETLKQQEVACIFIEPQFSPAQAQQLASEFGLRVGRLDPLGVDIPQGKDFYFIWMQQLIDALDGCLSQELLVPFA